METTTSAAPVSADSVEHAEYYGARAMYFVMRCITKSQEIARWPIRYWTDVAVDAESMFGGFGLKPQPRFVYGVRANGTQLCYTAESVKETGMVFGKHDSSVLYFLYTDDPNPHDPRRNCSQDAVELSSYSAAIRHLGGIVGPSDF